MAKIEIDWDALVAVLTALLTKKHNGAPQPTVPTPSTPPAAPQTVTEAFRVASLELLINGVVGPFRTGGVPVPYTLEGDPPRIVLTGDTTSLDDGSTIWLDLAAFDSKANGIRIDLDPAKTPSGQTNHPELVYRQIWIAEDAETRQELGRIGGSGSPDLLGHMDNGVSFVPNRYLESGGMAVNARLKRKGGPIRIWCELQDVESNSFTTPEVR